MRVAAVVSITAISLRVGAMLGKFLLLAFLARVLSPQELGAYGLVAVTISFCLYLLGLDFYAYAQREILATGDTAADRAPLLRNQFGLYLLLYLLLIPPLALALGLADWDARLVGWLLLLLTLDHFSQELYRYLIVDGRVLQASIALFLRAGAWVFPVIAIMWMLEESRSLQTVFTAWAAGSALSILTACAAARQTLAEALRADGVDWGWVRAGIRTSLYFLAGTLAFRALLTLDRYLLEWSSDRAMVGVYTLYIGVAMVLSSVTDAGVVVRYYPRLVAAYRQGRMEDYRRALVGMGLGVSLLICLFFPALWLCREPLLHFLDEPLYAAHISALWILAGATAIYNLSLVPHFALYARKADRAILAAHLLALAVFLACAWALQSTQPIYAIACSLLSAMTALAASKLALWLRYGAG